MDGAVLAWVVVCLVRVREREAYQEEKQCCGLHRAVSRFVLYRGP